MYSSAVYAPELGDELPVVDIFEVMLKALRP